MILPVARQGPSQAWPSPSRPQEPCYLPCAVERALECAAEALFDPRLAGDFLSYRFQAETQSSTFPTCRAWARSLSRLMRHRPFVAFFEAAIAEGQAALGRYQPHARRAGLVLDREARRSGVEGLEALHARLLEDTHDPAWVTVVAFSLGRVIAAESSRTVARATWTADDEAWASFDRAYANAAASVIERLLAEGPLPPQALATRVGEGVPEALSTLAALVPDSDLFAAPGASGALTRQELGL